MLEKLVDEVFKRIILINHKGNIDSIPHSDVFIKHIESTFSIDNKTCQEIISILKESHKILIFEISKEDPGHNIEKVEGYVDADLSTIRKLKEIYQRILADTYEEEHHQKKTAYQIIREYIPAMNSMSRTAFGNIFNKAFMLDEFEKLLEKEYHNYSEDWKAGKLHELLKIHETNNEKSVISKNDSDKIIINKDESHKNQRAVDQSQGINFTKFSINKMLQIYGIDFFYRINLRKYNFEFITELIETRQINRKSDLKILKEMIQRLKLNIENDPKLSENLDKINTLERTVARFINIDI